MSLYLSIFHDCRQEQDKSRQSVKEQSRKLEFMVTDVICTKLGAQFITWSRQIYDLVCIYIAAATGQCFKRWGKTREWRGQDGVEADTWKGRGNHDWVGTGLRKDRISHGHATRCVYLLVKVILYVIFDKLTQSKHIPQFKGIIEEKVTGWLPHSTAGRKFLENAERQAAVQKTALKLYQSNVDFQNLVKQPFALSIPSVSFFSFLLPSFHLRK